MMCNEQGLNVYDCMYQVVSRLRVVGCAGTVVTSHTVARGCRQPVCATIHAGCAVLAVAHCLVVDGVTVRAGRARRREA